MIRGIVAVDQDNGIGLNGSMPWPRLNNDMKWFKQKTENNIVVMGSNTWKSLGSKALPNRTNVVISSRLQLNAQLTFSDPIEAIEILKERYSKKDIYIIGGQQLFESVMDKIEMFYVTRIDAIYGCDRTFNMDYVESNFVGSDIEYHKATDTTPAYTMIEYIK